MKLKPEIVLDPHESASIAMSFRAAEPGSYSIPGLDNPIVAESLPVGIVPVYLWPRQGVLLPHPSTATPSSPNNNLIWANVDVLSVGFLLAVNVEAEQTMHYIAEMDGVQGGNSHSIANAPTDGRIEISTRSLSLPSSMITPGWHTITVKSWGSTNREVHQNSIRVYVRPTAWEGHANTFQADYGQAIMVQGPVIGLNSASYRYPLLSMSISRSSSWPTYESELLPVSIGLMRDDVWQSMVPNWAHRQPSSATPGVLWPSDVFLGDYCCYWASRGVGQRPNRFGATDMDVNINPYTSAAWYSTWLSGLPEFGAVPLPVEGESYSDYMSRCGDGDGYDSELCDSVWRFALMYGGGALSSYLGLISPSMTREGMVRVSLVPEIVGIDLHPIDITWNGPDWLVTWQDGTQGMASRYYLGVTEPYELYAAYPPEYGYTHTLVWMTTIMGVTEKVGYNVSWLDPGVYHVLAWGSTRSAANQYSMYCAYHLGTITR